MKWLLPLLLLCGFSDTYYHQKDLVNKAQADLVVVHISWTGLNEINKHCPPKEEGTISVGCADFKVTGLNSICTIWVEEPLDFNDQTRLAVLGHEFWHCAGARHK